MSADTVVSVPIVGTGETANPIPNGTVAVTPGAMPDVVVNIISPVIAISVRFINLFLASLLGFLTLKMFPAGNNAVLQAIQGLDFWHLIVTGSSMALAPAGYGLVKDLITIFGRLERKYPLATGSI